MKAAEANARFHVQAVEPRFRNAVMYVPSVGQGDPYIHVRKMK